MSETGFVHLPKDIQRLLVLEYFDPLTNVRCFQTKLFWDLFPSSKSLGMLREYQTEAVRQQILKKQQHYFEQNLEAFSEAKGIPKEELKRCSRCNEIILIGVDESHCKCNTSWIPYGSVKVSNVKHCGYCGCRFIGGNSPHPMNTRMCDLYVEKCCNQSIKMPDIEPCTFSGYHRKMPYHRCEVKCRCCNYYVAVEKLSNHCSRYSYKPDEWICRSKLFPCWWQCGTKLCIQRLLEHESSCANTLLPCKTCGTKFPRHNLIGKVDGKIHRCDVCTCSNPFEAPPKDLPEKNTASAEIIGKLFSQGMEHYFKKQNLSHDNRK